MLLLTALILGGCAASRPYVAPVSEGERPSAPPDSGLTYEVILVGDAGDLALDGSDPFQDLLSTHLTTGGEQSAVVFLGDNLYPRGLPPIFSTERGAAEARLDVQIDMLRGYPGQIFFVPGNHDWDDGEADGLNAIRRQEAYLEEALGRGDLLIPSDGFPGPVTKDLTDDIRLVALDSQWWLHPYARPFGDTGDYNVQEPNDVLTQLQYVIEDSDDHKLLVVAHHPLLSNSSHAGVFDPKYHLFPLSKSFKGAYIPLPVLGSIVLFYNRFIGLSRQDLSHPLYEAYRQAVLDIIGTHEGLIFAAGHEHNLQYFAHRGSAGIQHVLVSGSGSYSSYTRTGGNSLFASPDRGFLKVRYFGDGSVWMEAWSINAPDAPIYTALLEGADPDAEAEEAESAEEAEEPVETRSFADSTVVVAVNPDYQAGSLRRWVVGDGWRNAWAQPVEIPVFDIGTEAGGLTPLQRGGGAQTRSLRLENEDGHQFVLRSIDKYPARALPEAFRYGLALDIAEEMTSAIHPYGAFIVPPLASAVGVYHTNPRVVYVPDDPRLGRYRQDYRNQIMLLEERPDEDQTHQPSFGRSENVIGSDKLYQEIRADNDHRVDQRAFLRARLFDLLLGDWDRHADQWRWASFEPGELDPTLTGEDSTMGKVYRPVPRDRDWAFNNRDGLFFKLARPFVPKLQGFQDNYGSLSGLTTNGSLLDQRFLNGLDRDAWRAEAESIRVRLSDEAIEAAVRTWPPEIFALDGETFIDRLKTRRDKLADVAERYYTVRARIVDVVGSDKHERFEVRRIDSRHTEVVMSKINREGEVRMELFRRVFDHRETDEVRLYGFGGDDAFIVTGDVWRGLKLRLIGGTGADTFVDSSNVRRGYQPHTLIYDTPTELEPVVQVVGSRETRFERADRYPQLTLGVLPQRYDEQLPLLYFYSNTEDGLFVGGGYRWTRQGFLKEPYARQQMIRANVAPLTGAFNAEYRGIFVSVLNTSWDAGLDASYRSPLSIRNFYGLGNGRDVEAPDSLYWRTRMTQARVAPYFSRRLLDVARVSVGPTFTFTRFADTEGRFLTSPEAGVDDDVFDGLYHLGLNSRLALDTRDDRVVPRRGFTNDYVLEAYAGLSGEGHFVRTSAVMAGFLTTPDVTWLTVAPRLGFSHTFGEFPFYMANTLGDNGSMRGYRADRFAGRTALFQNLEARVRVKRFAGYVGRGEMGLFAFVDNGRVWADGERSNRWHQGYGGGLWMSLLDRVVFNVTTAFSREDRLVTFGLGWFY